MQIASEVWEKLHSIHWFPYEKYAERLEREKGFTREDMLDMLAEFALDETRDDMGRDRAVYVLVLLSPSRKDARIEACLTHTNALLRTSALSSIMNDLTTAEEKLAFVRERLDWIAGHPECARDTIHLYSPLYHVFDNSGMTPADREAVLDFCRKEASETQCAASASDAFDLLFRHDPQWPMSDEFLIYAKRWGNNPEMHDNPRARIREALAIRNANAAGQEPSGTRRGPSH